MKQNFTLIALVLLLCSVKAQLPSSWKSYGIGGGGALFSPSVNPGDPNEIYLACDMGELFHSIDDGATWNMLNYMKIQGGHDSQVQFTHDPAILYSIDYTSIEGMDYIRPMKSNDKGVNWQVLPGNPYPDQPDAGILRLFADYENPDHVILAGYGTIYFSTDGGVSFHLVHTCISNDAGNHIAGVFFNGANIYIGSNDGLLVSSDNGQSFNTMSTTGIPQGEYLLSFAGAKQNGVLRFYCLTASAVWAGYQYGSDYWNAMKGVYRMDNANSNWSQVMSGINTGVDFPVFVGMAANNTDIVYLAGSNSSNTPIVMKLGSTGSWQHVFITNNNQNIFTGWSGYNGDHGWTFPEAPFGFTVDLNDANTVLFTDYSCAHITHDAGATWHQQYLDKTYDNPMGSATPKGKKYRGNGLENTSCWQLMWTDSLTMFGGYSDITGITSSDKGETWKFIPGLTQNSVYRLVKHPNGNIYACTSNIHDLFQSTRIYDAQINAGTGAVFFSTDGGASFGLLHDFKHPVTWIALDPANPDRMYASVDHSNKLTIGGIYKTDNLSSGAASVWTKMIHPAEANGHPFSLNVLNNGDLVVSFSARKPSSSSAFTDSSGVFYYNSSTASWAKRSDPNMRFWTQDVVVDPNDPSQNTWYASVFNGWGTSGINGTGGLFRTVDKGITWTRISDQYRVNSCSVDPANPDILYMTTETNGLWISFDATHSNPVFNRVAEYPFRHPVRVFFNPYHSGEVWVSGFGGGIMKKISGNANGTDELPVQQPALAKIFPNPAQNQLNIALGDTAPKNLNFQLTDITGRLLFMIRLEKNNTIDISGFRFPKGVYLYSISNTETMLQSGKLILD